MSAGVLAELLQACVAATLATVLLLVLRRPLRRIFGAELAYRCWLLVPAGVLAAWLPAPTLPMATGEPSMLGAVTLLGAPAAAVSDHPERASWLLAAWLLGAMLMAAWFAARQWRFLRRIERHPAEAYDRIAAGGPAVVGMLRARVLLPHDFSERYSRDEQALVIAHEQVHAARGDLWAQAFALVLRCLFWFNPVLHLGARRFGFDQELACDAAVVRRFPAHRRAYADAMLKTQLSPLSLPVACHWHSHHPLKERIAMLKHTLPGSKRRRAGSLVVLALLLAGSYAAWAAQPATSVATTKPSTTSAAPPLTRIREGEDLTPPAYPANALDKRQSGKVMLEVVFAADGHARKVTVVSATPMGVFDQAATDAALRWRLLPEVKDGKAIERTFRIPVEFKPDP